MLGFDRRDVRPALNLLAITMRDRYLGSRLGMFWAILNPLIVMFVFVFLYGFIFKIRLPGTADSTTYAFAIWLIGGYGPWVASTEALGAAASSVLGAAAMVKNVAFKTELLPVAAVLSSVVTLAVTLTILMVLLVLDGRPSLHALLAVPVFFIHYLMLASLGLVLATFAVFFRDIVQILPNVFMVILLTSPILLPIESLPRAMRIAGSVNPFYIVADGYRAALVHQRMPDFASLLVVGAISALVLVYGLRIFRRAKGHFEAYL